MQLAHPEVAQPASSLQFIIDTWYSTNASWPSLKARAQSQQQINAVGLMLITYNSIYIYNQIGGTYGGVTVSKLNSKPTRVSSSLIRRSIHSA